MKRYCKKCGYVDENNLEKCPICQSLDWEDADVSILKEISNDENFINVMIDLKQKDPIEYQLKMSQFKANLSKQESAKQVEEQKSGSSNQLTCPKLTHF